MMKHPRSNFTLIELIVAMGVMLSVASLLALSSKIFYDGYRRSLRVTNMLKEKMAIDRIMDNLVRGMVPFHWNDSDGTSRLIFEGLEDTMLFAAMGRAGENAEGAFFFVRLRVEENKLVANYSRYPRLQWDPDNELAVMKQEVIAENVAAISFSYAETGSGDDPLEWSETWEEEDHSALPLAIQMRVEWLDGTSDVWLRRTAGVSAHSTFGIRDSGSTSTGSTAGTGNSGSSSSGATGSSSTRSTSGTSSGGSSR